MSRLMIKNLPAHATPETLRAHFSRSDGPGGVLTDVKVARKTDGTARRFGFVGYKSDEEALKAREWFDKTFVGSARIRVDVVDGVKDAPTPRPNKRPRFEAAPAVDKSAHAKPAAVAPPNMASLPEPKKSKKSAELEEFMSVMQPRSKKGPSWADDAQPTTSATKSDSKSNKKQPPFSLPTDAETPMDVDDKGEGMSDLDWMRKRMSRAAEGAEKDKEFVQSDDEDRGQGFEVLQDNASPEVDPVKSTILETARLFVRNLPFTCTEEELSEHFQSHGELVQVHIPVDSISKTAKGMAYVKFKDPSGALAAFETLDKTSFQGRILHILPAVDRKSKAPVEEKDGKKKTLKEERNAKRKAAAGREFNWAMLYMNSDAVVSSIADRMSISKADILNPDSDNAAVKLALAETHVISETKSYLTSQGVDLASFAARGPRSETVLLVKNIPYGTGEDGIRQLFDGHGTLTRVLIPPAGTIAIVEFERPDECATAFRSVAYRRLGNAVVYLEKAPADIFAGTISAPEDPPAVGVKPITVPENAGAGHDAEGDIALSAGTTLFVKNLSFATGQDKLARAFAHLPGYAFARVQMRPDPKNPTSGVRVSSGYGFVGFRDAEGARRALNSMQGYTLDGHALAIKFAGRGAEDATGKPGTEGKERTRTTKMIVKNLPFEASKKDVRELFGAHGSLKSVRVPKKLDHRSRGFAFLEFSTRQEAENAYEALKHTHLLGRHLVLEWAAEGEQDLDALRAKAGVGYGGGKELPGRKRKLDMDGDDIVEDEE